MNTGSGRSANEAQRSWSKTSEVKGEGFFRGISRGRLGDKTIMLGLRGAEKERKKRDSRDCFASSPNAVFFTGKPAFRCKRLSVATVHVNLSASTEISQS